MGANLRATLAPVKHPGYYDFAVLGVIAKDVAIAAKFDFQLTNSRRDRPPSFGEIFERHDPTSYRIDRSFRGGWIHCREPIVKAL